MIALVAWLIPLFGLGLVFIALIVSPVLLTALFGSEKSKEALHKTLDGYGGPPGWE